MYVRHSRNGLRIYIHYTGHRIRRESSGFEFPHQFRSLCLLEYCPGPQRSSRLSLIRPRRELLYDNPSQLSCRTLYARHTAFSIVRAPDNLSTLMSWNGWEPNTSSCWLLINHGFHYSTWRVGTIDGGLEGGKVVPRRAVSSVLEPFPNIIQVSWFRSYYKGEIARGFTSQRVQIEGYGMEQFDFLFGRKSRINDVY